MPTRVRRLSAPASSAPAAMQDRSTPAPTDSQRQIATSSPTRSGNSRGAAKRVQSAAWNRRARSRSRRALRASASRPRGIGRPRFRAAAIPGEGSLREGRVRPAHAPTVAGNEYAGEGGLRLVVADDRKAARVGVPAVVAAEEPRELGRGMEAVSRAHRVHVEGPPAPRDGASPRVDAGEGRLSALSRRRGPRPG